MDEVAKDSKVDEVYYAEVETSEFDSYLDEYEVNGVPEFLYFEDGELVDRISDAKYSTIEADTTEEYFEKALTEFVENNK